jgi:hypothetical protein
LVALYEINSAVEYQNTDARTLPPPMRVASLGRSLNTSHTHQGGENYVKQAN